MTFDPEIYTFKIKKEISNEDELYVGMVEEFPDITVYEESWSGAYEALVEILKCVKEAFDEENKKLPEPALEEEFSGRTTLRMSKSLHKNLIMQARIEDVSLNTLVCDYLSRCITAMEIKTLLKEELQVPFQDLRHSISALNQYTSNEAAGVGMMMGTLKKQVGGLYVSTAEDDYELGRGYKKQHYDLIISEKALL